MHDVRIEDAPPCVRLSLRCAPGVAARLGAALGPAIPLVPLTANEGEGRAALWLGPDEWLLLAEPGAEATLPAALAAAAGAPLSVVDISHRHTALRLSGAAAPLLLAEFCPLDLSDEAFPPGACTRTLFGKLEIVLWRPARDSGAQVWHIETGRSFATHLRALLEQAAADLD